MLLSITQTESIIMMTKEVSTQIVNFMTSGAGVLVLGRDHIQLILIITLTFYYVISDIMLETQNTKPFLI